MIQLTILFKFYLEKLKSYLRTRRNNTLLAKGYVLYNTRGRNTIHLGKLGEQINSSGRTTPCKMHDEGWILYQPSKHKVRKAWPKK